MADPVAVDSAVLSEVSLSLLGSARSDVGGVGGDSSEGGG
jgi:hypothetical protein